MNLQKPYLKNYLLRLECSKSYRILEARRDSSFIFYTWNPNISPSSIAPGSHGLAVRLPT